MKVALVSSGSGSRGGGEIYLRFLATGLRSLGHEVHVLVPAAPIMDELSSELAHCAVVHRFAMTPTYHRRFRNISAVMDRPAQSRLAAYLRALAPDVVHINQQVAEDGLDFLLGAMKSGLPTVSTIHIAHSAGALGAKADWVRDRVTVAILRRVSVPFITVSAASKTQLLTRLGSMKESSVHVVHNGVPSASESALARGRAAARAEWNVESNAIVIGCVGRIEEQKNALFLVDITRDLANAGHTVRPVWIGDGCQRGALEKYAAAAQLPAPLIVDGWRRDAATRLAGFDVYLLPSKYEGLPLALLEALHAGLPVIAARTDGMPEAIRHSETGFLCTTPRSWREAVERCVRDAGLRQRLSQAARRDALERFSLEAMARETVRVYHAAQPASVSTPIDDIPTCPTSFM